ncbi:glycosyltransferase [Candidatus Woesearchaeota archaeon]|nr:glycosyltransferase [Candidatus Woesearchaeota archaeon]
MATITLSMIARDEEAFIASAIESVKDVVDEIIVVDTGSKDSTAAIAKELGAKVLHFKWNDDFSSARNFGLKEATSDWALVLDADEEILKEQAPKLRQMAELGNDAYMFVQKNFSNTRAFGFSPEARKGFKGFYPSFIFRMFRTGKGINFEGFVHETIDASLAKIKARIGMSEVPIYHYQELKGADVFREKQLKYAELLEKGLNKYTDKAKTYHHIGIAYYRFRDDYEKAISCFEKSIQLNNRNAFVHNDLAASYAQTGEYKKALDSFGESLKIRPEPSTFYNIGFLQEKLGDYEAAAIAYEEAARRNHPKKTELLDKSALLRSLMKKENDGKQQGGV